MGDWLDTGAAFGGGVATVLRQIRERGFEPAISVAPFVAEKGSRVFREHPEWFVADASGAPLAADKVTFGGWRHGPWFALDGTHPEAQRHLEPVFRTMREQWGARTSGSTPTSGERCTGGASTIHAPRASRPTGGAWKRCAAGREMPSCWGATIRSGPRSASSTARAAPTTSSGAGRAWPAPRARTCGETGRAAGCGGTTRMPWSCLLNWSDAPETVAFRLPGPHRIRDVWSDVDLGVHPAGVVSQALPAHSGRLLAGTPAR